MYNIYVNTVPEYIICMYMYDYMYAHKYAVPASISRYDLSDFIFKLSIYMYISSYNHTFIRLITITILCYNIDIHTCINYKCTCIFKIV